MYCTTVLGYIIHVAFHQSQVVLIVTEMLIIEEMQQSVNIISGVQFIQLGWGLQVAAKTYLLRLLQYSQQSITISNRKLTDIFDHPNSRISMKLAYRVLNLSASQFCHSMLVVQYRRKVSSK